LSTHKKSEIRGNLLPSPCQTTWYTSQISVVHDLLPDDGDACYAAACDGGSIEITEFWDNK